MQTDENFFFIAGQVEIIDEFIYNAGCRRKVIFARGRINSIQMENNCNLLDELIQI